MKKTLLFFALLAGLACSGNGRQSIERDIGRPWCEKRSGEYDVRLSDGTRCDCLTRNYAIEIDFAGKWEALEQSLHYARITRKSPGILFICRSPNDRKKIDRTLKNLRFYRIPIRIWRKNC